MVLEPKETKWLQAGQVRLATRELLYLGHDDEDAAHTEGVATLMPKKESTESSDRMGSTQLEGVNSNFPNEEDQHKCDTVLRPHK
jgi:hypothetical protein